MTGVDLGRTLKGAKAELDLQEFTSYKSPRRVYRWESQRYEYVRKCREQGIKPRTIAARIGIPVTTVYRWKKRPPKWVTDVFKATMVDQEALAYVLGVLLGDGYIGGPKWFLKKNYPISLTVKDSDFAKTFAEALSSVLGKVVIVRRTIKKYRGKPWVGFNVATKHRAFSLWYHALTLPLIEIITHNSASAFIRGFADSEGSVHNRKNAIRIFNTDKGKLLLVKSILSKMHIESRLVKGNPRNHTVDYLLISARKNIQTFAQKVGFSIARKQERLEAKLQ